MGNIFGTKGKAKNHSGTAWKGFVAVREGSVGNGIPRTAVYALVVFLGSALWNFAPTLLFMTTGMRLGAAKSAHVDLSAGWIQVALLVFVAGTAFLLFFRRRPGPVTDMECLLAAGFSILFLYLGYTLQDIQFFLLMSHRQADSFNGAFWLYLGTGALFVGLIPQAPKRGEWALGIASVFLLAVVYFSVRSFPLLGGFSDMLLTMEAGERALLHGRSPYGLQMILGHEMRCCYPPGLWLPILPAMILNMDPRFFQAIYELAFAFLVWRGMGPQERLSGSWFLVLFLLNPWALFRQDVYLSAYLFSWGAFFLALRRGRRRVAAACFGWGLSAHPFSWALLPVWVAWNAGHREWKEVQKEMLWTLGVAALVILPFLCWDPVGFFQGAVMHWVGTGAVAVSHFGLAVWLASWPFGLTFLALLFLGAGTWTAWRGAGTLDGLFQCLAGSLVLALLASYHVEHYYYFVPLALILFNEIVLLGGSPGW